jgi:hypothetical protein
VGIDEARHGAHAPRVDHLQPPRIGRTRAGGNDLAAADNDSARRNDRAVADDDAGIRDREILRVEGAHTQQAEQKKARLGRRGHRNLRASAIDNHPR